MGDVVGATYADLGVIFNNAFVDGFGLPGVDAWKTISHTNDIDDRFEPQPSTPISADFLFAVNSVSLTGIDVGFNGFILTAYDALAGGSIVDSKYVFGSTESGSGEYYKLNVTGQNIWRVEFSQVTYGAADGITFDSFTFERSSAAAVPEPGSLALTLTAAFGFLGTAFRKRRSKNKN
jgi:hypothetical protein